MNNLFKNLLFGVSMVVFIILCHFFIINSKEMTYDNIKTNV